MCGLKEEKLDDLVKYYEEEVDFRFSPHPEWLKGYKIAMKDVKVLLAANK